MTDTFSNGIDGSGRDMRYAVRALLFNSDNQLLMINYAPNPTITLLGQTPVLRDNWGTAGGGIDPGEDLHAALKREIDLLGSARLALAAEVPWREIVEIGFESGRHALLSLRTGANSRFGVHQSVVDT